MSNFVQTLKIKIANSKNSCRFAMERLIYLGEAGEITITVDEAKRMIEEINSQLEN